MKKTILISLLATILCCSTYGATLQRTILSHKGQLTAYDVNNWTDAISDAVAGDTVYFTSGFFPGDATITKPITLIGTGVAETDAFWYNNDYQKALGGRGATAQSTKVGGSFIVDIEGNPTLTKNLFEGFLLGGSIIISKSVKKLSIKRCQFVYFNRAENTDAVCDKLVLENCYIADISCGLMTDPDLHNCYFDRLHLQGNPLTIRNCAFNNISGATDCIFINCLDAAYDHYDSGANTYLNCTIKNFIWENGSTYTDCWEHYYGNEAWPLSVAELTSLNHIGDDGTVVGPLGGPAPFTLIPSQPYVSSSSVTYNKTTKKLNVNVTVKKGQ